MGVGNNINGLQLADLAAYPIARFILDKTCMRAGMTKKELPFNL